MYLFRYACRIDPSGYLKEDPDFDKIGGAYVNVWVNFQDYDGATMLARYYAQHAGWLIDSEIGVWKVKKSKTPRESKAHVAEAAKFGYCTASYLWPKDAPDATVEYDDA